VWTADPRFLMLANDLRVAYSLAAAESVNALPLSCGRPSAADHQRCNGMLDGTLCS
jgi:hypothetical protein